MNLPISSIDLIIVVLYLAAVATFGVWLGRGTKTATDYLLAGRDSPWWAILGSIVATETSTATFLSVPGVAYARETGNLQFLQLTFGYIAGRALIVFLLLPQYFKGQLFSAYEVLDNQFGRRTKRAATVIFLVTRNLGDGLRLFLTAIVLKHVADIPLPLCVVIIGVVTIAYTFAGGMKAVIWNDCLQFVVYMAGGVIALLVIAQRLPDGWSQFWDFAVDHDKLRVFDFQLDVTKPLTFWAGLIGGMFLTLGTHGTDQMMVQRCLAARSQRDAGLALFLSGVVVLVQFALFLFVGVALASFYDAFPPTEEFAGNDHVFASFIVHELPTGIAGITLAAAFAAAMSTLSSSLNSSTAAAVDDILLTGDKGERDGAKGIRMSQLLTVAFGVVQIVIAIAADHVDGSVVSNALTIAGFSAGLLLGLFLLGLTPGPKHDAGALVGLAAGLAVLSAVWFGPKLLEREDLAIAWPWFALIGCATTLFAGFLANDSFPRVHLTRNNDHGIVQAVYATNRPVLRAQRSCVGSNQCPHAAGFRRAS